MSDFLPYGRQSISEADIDAVVAALRSDWLTQGPFVEKFEERLAETTTAEHTVVCANGTAALHLAAMAAGLGQGTSAVVPAITFVATANAVRMTGAEVLFADVDPNTGRLTDETLAHALERANDHAPVLAVFPVHLTGVASSLPEMNAIAAERDIIIIEDACHALGSEYERNGKLTPVGRCADSHMACFSFHPVKPVTTGEGGAITTNDAGLAARMRRLRSHGITRERDEFQNTDRAFEPDGDTNPWYYEMLEIGWNYRLTDIQCALGWSQLERLYGFRHHRGALASRYRSGLAALQPLLRPAPDDAKGISGHHLFVVLIDFETLGRSRGSVMRELRSRGIGTQVHYIPVPWQPYYASRYPEGRYPGAARYYGRCLSLPLHATMTLSDVDRVVEVLGEVLNCA